MTSNTPTTNTNTNNTTLPTLNEDEVASPEEQQQQQQHAPTRAPRSRQNSHNVSLMGPILRRKKVVSLPLGVSRRDVFFDSDFHLHPSPDHTGEAPHHSNSRLVSSKRVKARHSLLLLLLVLLRHQKKHCIMLILMYDKNLIHHVLLLDILILVSRWIHWSRVSSNENKCRWI